jgi:hypothetical protein
MVILYLHCCHLSFSHSTSLLMNGGGLILKERIRRQRKIGSLLQKCEPSWEPYVHHIDVHRVDFRGGGSSPQIERGG